MPQYPNSLDSEIRRILACIEIEYELRKQLYNEFLKNFNIQHSRHSYNDFMSYYNELIEPKTYPKANKLLSLFMPPELNLFQNSPHKANIAAWGRMLGVFLVLAMFPPTNFTITLACAALLFSGSLFYLGMATYDYFKTLKPLRTNLQKFNMLSSIPSTLLVAGFCVASIFSSLALPGASIAAFSLYCLWAVIYKAYQNATGARIKTEQYSRLKKLHLKTKNELNELIANPIIYNRVTSILADSSSNFGHSERQTAELEIIRSFVRESDINQEPIIGAQNDMPQEVIVIDPDNQVSLGIYRGNFFESAQTTGQREESYYPLP